MNHYIKKIYNGINNFTLNKKLLVLYAMIMILFLFALGYSIYYYTAFTLKNEVISFAEVSARQMSKSMDVYIDEMSRLSSMTLTDGKLLKIMRDEGKKEASDENMADYEYILGFLFNIYAFSPDLYSANLITSNGRVYSELNSNKTVKFDITKESWFGRLDKNTSRPLIIGPRKTTMLIDDRTEKTVISVVREIITPDGTALGTIIIDKKYDSFCKIFSEMEKEQRAKVIVLDDKRILYNSDGNSEKYPEWIDSLKKDTDKGQLYKRVRIEGEMSLVIMVRSVYTGWNTIVAVPERQLLSGVDKIKLYTLIMILISTIISVFICYIISSGVTRPVKKLTALMKRVEEGDFSVSIDINSKDEIGELGRGFNHMILKINLLLRKMVELEVRKKESEFKSLQSQINPHFLYNTLESIRMKCIVNGEREIAQVINTLGILFRLSIDREDNFSSIWDELEHVRHYMTIQNFRYDNKFKLIINVDKELMQYKILKLMLQPLVENSILHGLEMKPDNGYIKIDIFISDRILNINIIDNGLGMNSETYNNLVSMLDNSNETGARRRIGIRNVNERIKIFFGEEYGLKVISRENEGTTINIRMPAFKDESEVRLFV